jgi:hypothetical protein
MPAIGDLERLEYLLLTLSCQLAAGSDDQQWAEASLEKVRGLKRLELRAHPEILRKGSEMMNKSGRMGDQTLKDTAHNCLRDLTDGEACKAYKAGGRHSGTVNTALHEAHHALVRAGAKCEMAAAGEPIGEERSPLVDAGEARKMAREWRDRAEHESRMATMAKTHPAAWRLGNQVQTSPQGQGQSVIGDEQEVIAAFRRLSPSQHPAFHFGSR